MLLVLALVLLASVLSSVLLMILSDPDKTQTASLFAIAFGIGTLTISALALFLGQPKF
jgi:low temperature requirement protein LtrA